MDKAADPADTDRSNSFQRIAGVFVSPTETLRAVSARPDWLIPLIVIMLLAVVGAFVVSPRLDFESGMRAQFEKQGLSKEQQERAIEVAEKIGRFTPYISLVTVPVVMLLISGAFMLAFRIFGGEGSFAQYFSLTLYAWMPQSVKSVILTGIIAFREKVRVDDIPTLVRSNLAFLAGDPVAKPVLFSLLSSIDVFTIWTLLLLIIGYGFASKMRREQSAAMVIALWVVVVIFQVAIAALRGAAS